MRQDPRTVIIVNYNVVMTVNGRPKILSKAAGVATIGNHIGVLSQYSSTRGL